MPPTAIPQTGLVNSTQTVKALQAKIKQKIDQTYVIQLPWLAYLYSKGRVEGIDSYVYEWTVDTAPSANAGARDIGERLPGDLRKINGVDTRFDLSLQKKKLYLSHFYGGIRRDGLFMEAAGANKRKLDDILARQVKQVQTQMKFQEEIHFAGEGTGELAQVSSASGRRVVVKRSDGTLANAGQFGLTLIRFPNRSIRFVNGAAGTFYTQGSGAGFKAVELDKANHTLVLDRTAPTLPSGTLIVEGDDEAHSFGKGFPGIGAWIGNADDRLMLCGLNRANPANDHMNALVVDMATDDGALGQLNPAKIEEGMINVNFANDGKIDTLIHHPLMRLELVWGALIEGGEQAATTSRTKDGYMTQRRFMQDGELALGFSGIRQSAGPFGTVTYLPMWHTRPNNVFGITSGTINILQWDGGVRSLGGGAGDDGQAVRVPFYDTYDWAWCRSVTMYVEGCNKNVRWRNVLQQAPIHW